MKRKFEYHAVELLKLTAPDGNKTLEVIDSYVNGVYQHTCSMLSWGSSGSGIFYIDEQGQFLAARWIDNQNLEVKHTKNAPFSKKEETFYCSGDEGIIKYIVE